MQLLKEAVAASWLDPASTPTAHLEKVGPESSSESLARGNSVTQHPVAEGLSAKPTLDRSVLDTPSKLRRCSWKPPLFYFLHLLL